MTRQSRERSAPEIGNWRKSEDGSYRMGPHKRRAKSGGWGRHPPGLDRYRLSGKGWWKTSLPVSTRVNNPRNDDAALIKPEGEPLAVQKTLI